MLWGAMAVLCEVMWAPSLRGENMKAAGPRRKLSSIQLYPSGVALQGNSRHTAPGGRDVPRVRLSGDG